MELHGEHAWGLEEILLDPSTLVRPKAPKWPSARRSSGTPAWDRRFRLIFLTQRSSAVRQMAVSTKTLSPHEAAPLLPRPLPQSAPPPPRRATAPKTLRNAPHACQVPGCPSQWAAFSPYSQRARLCTEHIRAESFERLDGTPTCAVRLAFSDHTVRPGSIVRHCQKCNKVTR